MPSSYVIGEHFEGFVKEQVKGGRYASASEVIRDGLRALEERERLRAMRLESLRVEIQRGIVSGPARPLADVHSELKRRYQQWADNGAPDDAL